MKLLTNLIFEPKGMHNPALAYNIKDTVMSADGSRVYFALQDVPAGTALSNSDYWKLQIDLSNTKSEMENALASFGNYAKEIGTRVKGETAKASGNPVSFLPDAGSLLQPVTVLEPQQEGSGDPSPDNIRPISGYNTLGLNHAGKNLVEKVVYGYIAAGSTEPNFNVDNDSVSAIVHVVKGQQYKISCAVPFDRLTVAKTETTEFAAQQKLTNVKNFPISELAFTAEFTGIAVVYLKSKKDESVKDSLQIELGSTASPFEPYVGKLHTVQIGQTVYGGKMNWLTGRFRAEWWGKTFNGTEGLTVGGNGTLIFKPEHAPVNGRNTAISSHYPGDRIYCGADINIQNALDGIGYDTWAAFTAAQYAAGTPVQVVWPLASPIEIQLTTAVISAAEPEQTNTLYGDGRIDVEYVKPLHVSIEERVAAALAAMAE